MRKILGAVICLGALAGCNSRSISKDDVVGTWNFENAGSEGNLGEASSGEIIFRPDGTFEAKNVSGTVLKINDSDLHSGKGTWTVEPEDKNPIERVLERPAVTLNYEEHGIPFDAHYSEDHSEKVITFARDEEAGEWVKYKKAR